MSGKVVHFEIPFQDGDRARSFYREAFGWQTMEMPEMGYTIVTTGPRGDSGPAESGVINGGMLSREQAVTSGPVIESVEVALERISELGGSTVVGRTPVGDMGFAAYFTDSEGNVMGPWETVPEN